MLEREGGERCKPLFGKFSRDLILESTSCNSQDCCCSGTFQMDPTSEMTAQLRIPASSHRHSDEVPCREVFGFQVAANQYAVLSESAAQSSGRVQGYSSLVNPRTTRLQRLQAAQEEAARGNSTSGGILELFTPSISDAQESLYNVEPVASNSAPAFFHSFNSLSVQTNELGTGDFFERCCV